ncbi:MAG: DNA polymerase III subunit epsilon [Gammaproteobacteria bacterium]|nr:DNA polymerase III subunit epsilon [Gammaproteobacteria bacterium]
MDLDKNVVRQIVLDTETTGLEPSHGHRIIEIGAVEVIGRTQTGNHYHQYLQPDRESDEAALAVHGITTEFLADKPRFADVVEDFLNYVKGAQLIIHNAPFDVGFINHELKMLGTKWGKIEDYCTVLDSLVMAREKHPGQKNNLDALCRRYDINNSHRELHGALLDSEILADVYLAMTGGQVSLGLGAEGNNTDSADNISAIRRLSADRSKLHIQYANTEELESHEKRLQTIQKASDGKCIWLQ